ANQDISFNPQVCADGDGDGIPDGTGPEPFDPENGTTCFSLGGGNAQLEPYKSTSLDVSFERYFGEASAVSLAIFHKELEDWVVGSSSIVDVSQQAEAAGFSEILQSNPEFSEGIINGPVNLGEGSITGIEATARLSMDPLLPEDFSGFGLNASYTYADNEVTNELGEDQDIPGYSDTTWSAEVYYENFGFRARLIGRYQSEYLSEVRNFSNLLENATAEEELTIDAQIGYEWYEGPLEGFSVNFEAYNLTDEPFTTIEETAGEGVSFPSRHELYGTTYNFTIAKKF
ncbi:MAG: TonB-dependent receptor, partial [Alphaproteobacteria bacterium]|nr:TonB-dependent receptor [Alphaproteobacteria bacterium]